MKQAFQYKGAVEESIEMYKDFSTLKIIHFIRDEKQINLKVVLTISITQNKRGICSTEIVNYICVLKAVKF